MPDIGKWVELLKSPPRVLFGIMLASGVMLYGSAWLPTPARLSKFPTVVSIIIVICFFGATGLFVSHWVAFAITFAQGRWKQKRQLEAWQVRLHHLTPEEKDVLRTYIATPTNTQYFAINNGVVAGLVAEHVIAQLSGPVDYCPHNIQPWARAYLNAHPELLAEPQGAAQE
jgi:hypothetical protein